MKKPIPARTRPGLSPGFTLIEVVVVIAVLSILATAVAPLVAKQVLRKKSIEARERLVALSHALEDHYLDRSELPASLSDATFVTGYVPAVVGGAGNQDPFARGGLLFGYSITSIHGTATLRSRGENGVDEGGAGDDLVIVVSSQRPGHRLTRERLSIIAVALQRFLAEDPANALTGDWPGVDRAALDLDPLFDRDGWKVAFRSQPGMITVESAGPDRVFDTPDDLGL